MKKHILVIHGPNLNLLGEREPGIYGSSTLEMVNNETAEFSEKNGAVCEFFQSNSEGELIDAIHKARKAFDGIVINAGAYTHYSYALRDAIAAVRIPCVEVHLSNINARDEFRKNSVIAPVCVGSVVGFGKLGYKLAIAGLLDIIKN